MRQIRTPVQQDALVLAYYELEVTGAAPGKPLAGLSLEAFRLARQRLLGKGLLVRTSNGRYAPVDVLNQQPPEPEQADATEPEGEDG
ncbi:MAG TPA: hypothetical protein VFZ00_09025 [Solirubrobacter sp.]|nr:hypothetical protein [Solirubrobacter sp.]